MPDNIDEKNQLVEDALFETALGYYRYDEDEIYNPKTTPDGKLILDANGEPILVLTAKKRKKKWHQSSVNAQRTWLEANNPEKYGGKSGIVKDQIDQVLNVLTGSVSAWDESEEDSDDDKESE